MSSSARVQKAATSRSLRHLLGVGTVCVGTIGGGGILYYKYVWLPQTQRALQRKSPLLPPQRRTPLYIAGSGDATFGKPLHHLPHLVFYGLVLLRMVLLVSHMVPLMWYALLTYGFGLCSEAVMFLKVREALSAMGPSYIKFGQWVASRPDFFPEGLCNALEQLYDNTEPHRWSHTEALLRRTFLHNSSSSKSIANDADTKNTGSSSSSGSNITGSHPVEGGDNGGDQVSQTKSDAWDPQKGLQNDNPSNNALHYLYEIETKPVNSGSIAQIHRAVLRETIDGVPAGTELAVKVVHPHIRAIVAADIAAMRCLVNIITFIVPGALYLDLHNSLREFSCLIRSQLNLLLECDNLQQFIFNFRDFPGIIFPRPLPSLCTEDVLIETFEAGQPLQEIKSGENYRDIAERGCHMFLKMLFEDNFVHSDLHPGNVLLRTNPGAPLHSVRAFGASAERYPDGKVKLRHELVILDTGLVTRLSNEERNNFIALFAAVACGDGELGADLMLDRLPEAQKKRSEVNREKFRSDMKQIFDLVAPSKSSGFKLSNIHIGEVLGKIMRTLRENKTPIDGNFASLVLTVIVGEGLGRRLTPDFNIFAESAPFLIALLEDSELFFLATKLRDTYGTTALLRDSIQLVRLERSATYAEVSAKKVIKTAGQLRQKIAGESENTDKNDKEGKDGGKKKKEDREEETKNG